MASDDELRNVAENIYQSAVANPIEEQMEEQSDWNDIDNDEKSKRRAAYVDNNGPFGGYGRFILDEQLDSGNYSSDEVDKIADYLDQLLLPGVVYADFAPIHSFPVEDFEDFVDEVKNSGPFDGYDPDVTRDAGDDGEESILISFSSDHFKGLSFDEVQKKINELRDEALTKLRFFVRREGYEVSLEDLFEQLSISIIF